MTFCTIFFTGGSSTLRPRSAMKDNLWNDWLADLWLLSTVPGQSVNSLSRDLIFGSASIPLRAARTSGSDSDCPSRSTRVRDSIHGSPCKSHSMVFLFLLHNLF